MNRTRTGLPVLALVLSGCATGPAFAPGAGPATVTPPPTRAPGGARDETGAGADSAAGLSGATAALLAESQAERDAGDLGSAAATIERALTIAPDVPSLWLELAEIRFDQGDIDLATEMARKALTLTRDDPALQERARRLIGP